MSKKYLVFDIGCIECGEDSNAVGIFNTRKEAEASIKKYITNKPNENGRNWGRPEWHGEHSVEIFEIDVDNKDNENSNED